MQPILHSTKLCRKFNSMVYKGVEGDQRIFYSMFDGTNWTPIQDINGANTSIGAALADFGDLQMVYKGVEGDQRIFYTQFDGVHWSPPIPINDANTSTGPVLAVIQTQPDPGGH